MTNTPLDVIVIGNVGIDTNVYFYTDEIDFTVEGNFTHNVDYVGQAGGYTSRGYAQLGQKTAFIGTIGEDFNGRFIRHTFTQDGIDQTGLFIDPTGTARSINFMYKDGRRKNFYDGKGHMQLQPDLDLCRSLLQRAKLAHFHLPNWARQLLPIAKELGLVIACDIQDVVDIDDPYRQDFINYAHILFFSAVNTPDPTPLIQQLLNRNPNCTFIAGMGAKGCALGTSAGVQFFPPVSMAAPVIDTNGAGDGLAVGFLTSYILGSYTLPQAIQRGQIVARHTCTQKASSDNLITPTQLEHYYHENIKT